MVWSNDMKAPAAQEPEASENNDGPSHELGNMLIPSHDSM